MNFNPNEMLKYNGKVISGNNNTKSQQTYAVTGAENQNLTIDDIIEKLKQGDITALEQLTKLGIKYTTSTPDVYNFVTIAFDYNGQSYSFKLCQNTNSTNAISNETTTVDNDGNTVTTKYINGKKASETITSPDGKLISETNFDQNENITTKKEYSNGLLNKETTYDSNGNYSVKEMTYKSNGDISVTKESLYNSNHSLTKFTQIDSHGNPFWIEEMDFENKGAKLTTLSNGIKVSEEFHKWDANWTMTYQNKFDENGNIISKMTRDENGNKTVVDILTNTTFKYGSNDVLESETQNNEDGSIRIANYANGVKTNEIIKDQNGNIISENLFDENGNITTKKEYSNGLLNKETTYDSNGNYSVKEMTYKSNGDISVTKESLYDSKNNLTKFTQIDANGNPFWIEEMDFENKGAKLTTLSNGIKVSEEFHKWDDNWTMTYQNKFDENGNIIYKMTRDENGNKTVVDILTNTTSDYNPEGVITRETQVYEDGKIRITNFENGIRTNEVIKDQNGNIVSETQFDKNGNPIVTPDEPAVPDEPATPDVPATPDEPAVPDEPATPDVPATPDEPAVPDEPATPDVPATPDEPAVPDEPATPDVPATPEVPTDPNIDYYPDGTIKAERKYENGALVSEVEYDTNGNKIAEKKYENNKLTSEYTAVYNDGILESELLKGYDNAGNVTTKNIQYDKQGHKTREIEENNGKTVSDTKYEYDSAGHINKRTVKENGTTTTYLYQCTVNSDGSMSILEGCGLKPTARYELDKNGNIITKSTFDNKVYNSALKRSTITESVYNSNNQKIKEIVWKANQTVATWNSFTVKLSEDTINYDGDNVLITIPTSNGKTVEVYQNGVKIKTLLYDTKGELISYSTHTYDEAENTISENFDKDGVKISDSVTDKDNTTTSTTYIDKEGNVTAKTIKYNKNISYNGTTYPGYEDFYDLATGKISERRIYKTDGSVAVTQKYSYTYTSEDKKNYYVTKQDSNGNWHKSYYSNGKLTKVEDYNKSKGTVTTTNYDSNGNAYTAQSRLSGTISHGVTMDLKEDVYKAITNLDSVAVSVPFVKSYTGAQIVTRIGGNRTLELLRLAQPLGDSDRKVPSGVKTLNSYKDSTYASFLKDKLETQLGFGYTPDIVKGYQFSTSSALSQDIAKNSQFKAFVKKNLEKLQNGFTAESLKEALTTQFTSGDLYYALSQVNIINSYMDSSGKLHLTLADVYDFNPNVTGDSNGDKLNRVGAAAMADGKLVPYYSIIEVVIDPKTL